MDLAPGRRWPLFVIPPLFAIWANVHGLYVVGLGVVAIYVAFTLARRTPLALHRREVMAAGALSLGASALTPAGPAGLLYPLRYVDASDWGLAHIPEWQSPNFHDLVQIPLMVLIVLLLFVSQRGVPGWLRCVAYLSVVGALLANRNAPVAAVACLPALALGLSRLGPLGHPSRPPDMRRRAVEAAAAGIVVIAVLSTLPSTAGARGVVVDRYPAAAVDYLAAHDGMRVVAEYGWAGYVIHRLADRGTRLFVDGRNDMYPESLLEDYSTIRAGGDGWTTIVDSTRADALLFPPEAPIVRGIAQLGGWCEAFRDDTQVLLLRACAA
jgi:hypothetical protein